MTFSEAFYGTYKIDKKDGKPHLKERIFAPVDGFWSGVMIFGGVVGTIILLLTFAAHVQVALGTFAHSAENGALTPDAQYTLWGVLVAVVAAGFGMLTALAVWATRKMAAGIGIGILSGMLGIGGGTVLVPILRLAFGMSPLASTATSLFAIIPTSISGVVAHARAKTCVPKLGLALGVGGAVMSPMGVWLASVSPGWLVICVAALAGFARMQLKISHPLTGIFRRSPPWPMHLYPSNGLPPS